MLDRIEADLWFLYICNKIFRYAPFSGVARGYISVCKIQDCRHLLNYQKKNILDIRHIVERPLKIGHNIGTEFPLHVM